MLFQAIKSDCGANARTGAKVPAGLDCAGNEPRAKSPIMPNSIERLLRSAISSANVKRELRIMERLSAGVLNCTAKAGTPAAVMRFMFDGVVKRFVGDAVSKPNAAVMWCC